MLAEVELQDASRFDKGALGEQYPGVASISTGQHVAKGQTFIFRLILGVSPLVAKTHLEFRCETCLLAT